LSEKTCHMKKICLVLALLITGAWADNWKPAAGVEQRPLWPPKSPVLAGGIRKLEDKKALAGKSVTNVSNPTFTVYSPKSNPSGTCIVVFPGGGHLVLAMDIEGTEIADWLTGQGITCVLVKYRVPYSGCYWDNELHKHVTPKVPMALQDAQRAISIVRSQAQELHINPNKIGVMGFSAGGNVAVLASTRLAKRSYPPTDDIDKVSCRPDFAIPVYPGHLIMTHKNIDSRALNTDIVIPKNTPPTLLVHAKDDPIDPVCYSEVYGEALKKAGINVKLKLYETGGHAFGVRKKGKDCDRWTKDAVAWLKQIKML
jgi:acetyl esterase/lipase